MAAEEWLRAGAVIHDRMDELGLTPRQLAEKARVDPTTVRRLLRGERWPRPATRDRIMAALDWPAAEVTRRVWGGRVGLDAVSTSELLHELCKRFDGHEVPETGTSGPYRARP